MRIVRVPVYALDVHEFMDSIRSSPLKGVHPALKDVHPRLLEESRELSAIMHSPGIIFREIHDDSMEPLLLKGDAVFFSHLVEIKPPEIHACFVEFNSPDDTGADHVIAYTHFPDGPDGVMPIGCLLLNEKHASFAIPREHVASINPAAFALRLCATSTNRA